MATCDSENDSKRFCWKSVQRILSSRKLIVRITLLCLIFRSALYAYQNILLAPTKYTKMFIKQTPDFPEYSFSLSDIAGKFKQTRVDCSAIFSGDQRETKRAITIAHILAIKERPITYNIVKLRKSIQTDRNYVQRLLKEVNKWTWEFRSITKEWYLNATKDCAWFKSTRGYITSPLTQEEAEFPIAFSLLVYKDLEMVERLLRMVYRPQNFYCIHVDKKANPTFYEAVEAVAACFPDNVRISSRRVSVIWGEFSILEAELVCMKDLWEMDGTKYGRHSNGSQVPYREKWKYFINLTGQEFPLKTNYELVKILKAFKGANNGMAPGSRYKKMRWKTPAPHGITALKGSVHAVLNRATIDFLLHDYRVTDFLSWLKTTTIPDETLFASINFNPQLKIPGTYNGYSLTNVESYARYKLWKQPNSLCKTNHFVRGICILSTADLENMGKQPDMFANKFFLQQDRIVIGCLEERLFNNTWDEFTGRKSFNTSFYEQQDFVLHQVPSNGKRDFVLQRAP